MRLRGRNVAVVGVGPGLGSAVVYLALREGASVYAFARGESFLKTFVESMSRFGRVETGAYDFSRLRDAYAAAEAVGREFGVLHGLVVTAGGYVQGEVAEMSEEDLDSMLSANLKAHIYAVKAFLPLFQKGSSIVLVSSIGGAFAAWRRHVAYVASKAALARAAEALAAELLPRGVRVNAVAPGGMTKDFTPGVHRSAELGSPQAPPEEVAKVAVWLLTDEASWVTGAVFPVDGGRRLA